ncbi:MAG: SH3 domain-containing protein [Labilithrix sp.]|nr:SH3 domain-containing protein [Labilithrix sp.]MCW5816658.1 SH3 domain-containing protein [Labilithrix sp.]
MKLLPLAFVAGCLSAVTCLSGCSAQTSEEDVGDSTSDLTAGQDAVVAVDHLNLRGGPSTDHAVLAVMVGGERVRVRGGNENGFVPVTYDGIEGWAYEEYLRATGAPAPIGSLADAVAELASEAPRRSPGTELGIAVMNLSTGEYAGAGDDVRHVSASSAKVMWVAAAMRAGAGVGDIAGPIFQSSDNHLSGTAIDRAGGIDAVNETYWNVFGMDKSITANWSFGARRVAREQGLLGGDNYFTPRNVITFLSKLDAGELLGDRTDELETYMTWSPRSGWGGWMGTLLPANARASMMHKAGWLPPPDYAQYSTLNDVGIVQVPGGDRYAIALLARYGRNYGAEASMVERASCVVYRTIANDASLGCRD